MNDKVRRKSEGSGLWSDEELIVSIDSYLYLLNLELSDVSFSVEEMARFLIEGPLSGRNDASVRYRMRNISYVLSKQELPTLKAYSPASGVGSGVKQRIEKLLDERSEALSQIERKSKRKDGKALKKLDEVLGRLNQLEKYLSEMQESKGTAGIGHNNPPEPIERSLIDFSDVKVSVQKIRAELISQSPDKEKIKKEQSIIIKLGLELAAGAKARASDLTKAAVVAIGTGLGVKALGLGPHIADTLESLASFLRTFG